MKLYRYILALCLVAGTVSGDNLAEAEYRIKAACLFNFAKFVEWPPDTFPTETNAVVIAVLGDNPFGLALEQATAGRVVNGRPVRIRYARQLAEVEDAQLLFVSRSVPVGVLRQVAHRSVLTVGESDGFLRAGGMVRFVVLEKRVRFAIAETAATQAGLKINAQLLSLAVSDKEYN